MFVAYTRREHFEYQSKSSLKFREPLIELRFYSVRIIFFVFNKLTTRAYQMCFVTQLSAGLRCTLCVDTHATKSSWKFSGHRISPRKSLGNNFVSLNWPAYFPACSREILFLYLLFVFIASETMQISYSHDSRFDSFFAEGKLHWKHCRTVDESIGKSF